MTKLGTLSSMMVVAAILVMLAVATPAVAQDVTYSFELTAPQTATNGAHTIEVTGAGSFDPTAEMVVASGAFLITNNSNGAVLRRGTWKATAFNSFCPRGGPNAGTQGGVLVITVTLFPNGGGAITGLTMTDNARTCRPVGEGVTVADFTTIVTGRTLFHLND